MFMAGYVDNTKCEEEKKGCPYVDYFWMGTEEWSSMNSHQYHALELIN